MTKKIVLILSFCFFMIIPKVQATSYDMFSYEYQATVFENYSIEVKENYGIYAIQPLNTFERNLLSKQEFIRRDGKKVEQSTKVNLIDIDDSKNIVYSNKNEKTVILQQEIQANQSGSLEFQYKRDLGKVIRNTNDELFFYVVDGTFDTTISNVNFVITFPEVIEQDTLQFYVNGVLTTDVSYQISEKTVIGHLNDLVEENGTFAISMVFPKGYFSTMQISASIPYQWILLFPLICLLFGIYVYCRYQRGNKIHILQSFYPPKNFDSAEVAFLYRGYTKKLDIVSLLIVLANQGYIRFVRSKHEFSLQKIKEYDGKNALQKVLFDGLFHNQDIVPYSKLQYYLVNHEHKLKDLIDNKEHQLRIFEKNYKRVRILFCFLIAISSTVLIGSSIYLVSSNLLYALIFGFLFWMGLYFTFIYDNHKIVKGIGIFIFIGITILGGYCLYQNVIFLLIYMISILLLVIVSLFLYHLSERTRFGNDMLGKIAGFRSTLYYMSVTTLKEKQEENPKYFYQMIPYAYVFGFFDKWIMNGYQVISELPIWYQDDSFYSLKTFRQSLQTFLLGLEKENDILISENQLVFNRPKSIIDLDEK